MADRTNGGDHRTQTITDQVSEAAKDLLNSNELGKVRAATNQASRQLKSRLSNAHFNESTIPDAFQKAPKFISPTVHAWLDVAVTGYFLVLGAWFTKRRKRRPATAAFVNAGMVAGVSLLTDYHGTGKKPISFKMHGTLDAMQAATAAIGPGLHGFAGKSAAALFYGQAMNELLVIAATDWDAGMP